MDCKHEVHNGALDMLKDGKTDQVQCLKCGKALALADLPEGKKKKPEPKDE